MEFKIYKASDWEYERDVEINSLEDLQNLEERFIQISNIKENLYSSAFVPPYDIIIDFDGGEIIIRDYYIE